MLIASSLLACALDNPAYSATSASSTSSTSSGTSSTTTAETPETPLDWWDVSWRQRQPLTILNPTTERLEDPPIAIQLTPERFDYTGAKSDGSDLRVVPVNADAALDLEIETWDPAGNSTLWIRPPALPPGETRVWLYWGNPAADPPAIGDLWAAYNAVFHLSDALQEATIRDASGAHNATASPSITPANRAPGLLGEAIEFRGVSAQDLLAIDDPGLPSTTWAALTLEGWFQTKATDSTIRRILSLSSDTAPNNHVLMLGVRGDDRSVHVRLGLATGGVNLGGFWYQSQADVITSGDEATWHHLAATWDGSVVQAFLNGDPLETRRGDGDFSVIHPQEGEVLGELPDGPPRPVTIANVHPESFNGGERLWNGPLDELRLADRAHSPAWIHVQYRGARDELVGYGAAVESLD